MSSATVLRNKGMEFYQQANDALRCCDSKKALSDLDRAIEYFTLSLKSIGVENTFDYCYNSILTI